MLLKWGIMVNVVDVNAGCGKLYFEGHYVKSPKGYSVYFGYWGCAVQMGVLFCHLGIKIGILFRDFGINMGL